MTDPEPEAEVARKEAARKAYVVARLLRGEARDRFIDGECRGDSSLREAIEALLQEDDTRQATLPGAPREHPGRVPLPKLHGLGGERAPLPRRIGEHAIIRLLGEGGMGAVYEAEQDNPRRRVALKVVRGGATSTDNLRRFDREVQLLARLAHPGIARVFEAGIDDPHGDDPRPWFSMELVVGRPLTRHAREMKLDVRARLELLAKVCDAVEHAHAQEIVHRDLKPANILVDASGQPRVLDFGLARILSDEDGITRATATGDVLGTLSYMSPEQASGRASDVDSRSDVYSLGVLAYELLAGRRPHELDGLALPEAARVVAQDDPRSLASLDANLRGDVSTIVAKALEKEPERRYQTAGEMAADIRRYLGDMPIKARPPSTMYQLKKFASRHVALVVGTIATIVALAIGLLVATRQAVVADRARGEAVTMREHAQASQADALRQAYRASLAAAASALDDHDVRSARMHLDAAPAKLRGWEWRYFAGRLDDSVRLFPMTLPPELSVRWTEDGRALQVRCCNPWKFETIDASTGQRLAGYADPPPPQHELGFRDLQPESAVRVRLVDGSTCGWDAKLLRPMGCWPTPVSFNMVGVRPDGREAVIGTPDDVVVRDLATGEVRKALKGHGDVAWIANYRPDGLRFLTGAQDGTVCTWDATTLDLVACKLVHPRLPVRDAQWSPDGNLIATCASDGTVKLWTSGLEEIAVLHGHEMDVANVRFSPDGARLASIAPEGVRIWDVADLGDGVVLKGHESYVYSGEILAGGKLIASSAWDGTVRLWDAEALEPVAVLPIVEDGVPREVFSMAARPDGGRLAVSTISGAVHLVDVANRDEIAVKSGSGFHGNETAWSQDGRWIAVAWTDRMAVLDAATLAEKCGFDVKAAGLAWGPTLLAAGLEDGRTQLVDAETCSVAKELPRQAPMVRALVWDAPRGRLLTGDQDAIRAWDVATGELLLSVPHVVSYSFALSPDGERLASGAADGAVRLYGADDLHELVRLRGHGAYVHSVDFSPDGEWILSTSGDSTVRTWDPRPLKDVLEARRRRHGGAGPG